jgi:hypothetical protein
MTGIKAGACLLAGAIAFSGVGAAFAESDNLPFVVKERQRSGPHERPYAAIATSRGELRKHWDRFNQRGDLPTIRFEKNFAILTTLGGSGSCGVNLHDLRLKREEKRVIARMYRSDPGEGEGCTDDYVLYTFTVAVARADIRPLPPDQLTVRRREIRDPDPG